MNKKILFLMVLVASGIFVESWGLQRRRRAKEKKIVRAKEEEIAYREAQKAYLMIDAEKKKTDPDYDDIVYQTRGILITAPKKFFKISAYRTKIVLYIEDIAKEMINERKKPLFDEFEKKILKITDLQQKLKKLKIEYEGKLLTAADLEAHAAEIGGNIHKRINRLRREANQIGSEILQIEKQLKKKPKPLYIEPFGSRGKPYRLNKTFFSLLSLAQRRFEGALGRELSWRDRGTLVSAFKYAFKQDFEAYKALIKAYKHKAVAEAMKAAAERIYLTIRNQIIGSTTRNTQLQNYLLKYLAQEAKKRRSWEGIR
jgi:hypothetical protein